MDTVEFLVIWLVSSAGTILYFAVLLTFVFLMVRAVSSVERGIQMAMHKPQPEYKRDSVRVYTRSQKKRASQACNHRCEGTGLFFRCRYRGSDLHGDHWFPHSRGGATTKKNLVMLCPQCNRKKSGKIPSPMQTKALNMRRKIGWDYSMTYENPVGQWLPRGYSQPRIAENQRSWF